MDRLDPQYTEAVRYLYDRINYEKSSDRPYDQRTYRLARMEYFLGELGNPHLAAPVIHVAGTKGKGSVSWLIAEALRRSSLKVGLYTSPHLIHLEERFVLGGKPCSASDLVEQIDQLRMAAEATAQTPHGCPTFFEMTTALAWNLFASHQSDVNVIEVGLGGRLDSTNICNSSLAIITSISFDHQQQLGNTLSLIAAEKAGIVKPRVPVISGARHPEASQVIRDKCRETGSQLWELGVDFDVSVQPQIWAPNSTDGIPQNTASRMDFFPLNNRIPALEMRNLTLRMPGQHQSDNAAVAIAAWQRLRSDGWALPQAGIVDALANTHLPCRIEVVSNTPLTLIDTSHNVASIGALIQTLRDHFRPAKRTILFACSKDKEYDKMIEQILGYADRIILTQFQNNPRVVPVEKLEELAKAKSSLFPNVEILSAPTSQIAVDHATHSAVPNELICITGSFFLASEIRPLYPESRQSIDFQ
jgi:dihydrofolate synthase/folylpolyglutamate synthase